MATRKKQKPTAMLMIGNDIATIEESTKAITHIVKLGASDTVAVEALKTLVSLAKAPDSVSVMNSTFTA